MGERERERERGEVWGLVNCKPGSWPMFSR